MVFSIETGSKTESTIDTTLQRLDPMSYVRIARIGQLCFDFQQSIFLSRKSGVSNPLVDKMIEIYKRGSGRMINRLEVNGSFEKTRLITYATMNSEVDKHPRVMDLTYFLQPDSTPITYFERKTQGGETVYEERILLIPTRLIDTNPLSIHEEGHKPIRVFPVFNTEGRSNKLTPEDIVGLICLVGETKTIVSKHR